MTAALTLDKKSPEKSGIFFAQNKFTRAGLTSKLVI